MKILLIEDNPGDAVLLRALMQEAVNSPPEFHHAMRLGEALEQLGGTKYDVILLDLSLPDAFGHATFAQVQKKAPTIPIVVLTGLDDESLAIELAQAGAQDYLVKGQVDAKVLARSIHYAIERKRAEEKLRLAATVFESTLEGILITDAASRIISVNKAFADITGYNFEEVAGKDPSFLSSGRHPSAFFIRMWQSLRTTGQWRGEIWNRRKNGEIFPAWMNISAVAHAGGKVANYVAVFTEITDLKLSEERLRHLAHHDALTGLPNRLLFQDRLSQAVAQAQRKNERIAVMLLDLDRFKIVNDTLGHPVGDSVLIGVAARLQSCVRESDTVARLGGDEFAVIVTNVGHTRDVQTVAEKILNALSMPFAAGGHEVFVTTSIGIILYPDMHKNREKLLENADVAMYHAKEKGRNNYQFYTEEMNAAASERLMLETNLRRALERGEFLLHYQPQISLLDGRVDGVEALIRWQHPDRGLVSPMDFVPLLEETGLIIPVGEWALRTACRQCKEWLDAGLPPVRMAVNLSARQFNKQYDLVETVARILDETGLPPELLELELTESIVMKNVDETVAILLDLKEKGVKIAIDDFGTGASSLSYLKHLPLDTLKIAHSFVLNLPADSDDAAIASAVIALAHSMQLHSVAEGVETDEQLAFLRERDCDRMQGFLFSKPLPAEQLTSLLTERKQNPQKGR